MVFLTAPVTISYQIESKCLACSRSSSRRARREGPGAAPDDREVRTLLAFHKSVKIVKFAEKASIYSSCKDLEDSEYPLTPMSMAPMTMMKTMLYIWGGFGKDVDALIQKVFAEYLLCARHCSHRLKAARGSQATCQGCCCLPLSSSMVQPHHLDSRTFPTPTSCYSLS